MERRVIMHFRMELLSDTIFGSGFSIPGGEDIAVCKDEEGYPFLKGSTFKGLFRESLENLLAWSGEDADVDELLGRPGRDGGLPGARRIRFTSLLPEHRPATPEDCYCERTFTKIENGIVAEGSLRTAACVAKGMTFAGELECAERDRKLVCDAVRGVKRVGTLRNRGFGAVRVKTEEAHTAGTERRVGQATCLHYRLRAELPVLITDLSRSNENNFETRSYIPGSAIRGAVMGRLAETDGAWFSEHRQELLGEGLRFLNATPRMGQEAVLPAVKGFYGTGAETLNFFLKTGKTEPGQKRAKTGEFCLPNGTELDCWSARKGGALRIARQKEPDSEKEIFNTRYLEAGQEFDGYIRLSDRSLAPKLASAFGSTLWLGADKYAGFGKCTVTVLEAVEETAEERLFAARDGDELMYLLLQSPTTMLNVYGEPCGVDEARLAELLGVETAEVVRCSTSVSDYDTFNRTWGCRAGAVRMYDPGSVFLMRFRPAPAPERLRAVERSGLGVRTVEGSGQVLFLPTAVLDALTHKRETGKRARSGAGDRGRTLRRARIAWVESHVGAVVQTGLSASQLGTVQSLCEKAIAEGGSTQELDLFFKNQQNKSAGVRAKFSRLRGLTDPVLRQTLEQTLCVPCEDSEPERLALLCTLFGYVRKMPNRKGEN